MSLSEYRAKRNPASTPEPFGEASSTDPKPGAIFVVQKHDARRLHYDFRLAMEGVLRSWAVPRGPSLNPADKRLAVAVEDHPLEYGDFEGVIPDKNYGAGEVIVWDRGSYTTTDPRDDPVTGVRNGKLDIVLHGYKLRGEYTLVHTGGHVRRGGKDEKNWLLIKKRDGYSISDDVTERYPLSVLSGLSVEEMRDPAAMTANLVRKLEKFKPPKLTAPTKRASFPLELAGTTDQPFDGDQWLFELKYDGVRALAIRDGENLHLYARSGTDITGRYPEVALALGKLPYQRFVLDGEIVAQDEDGHPSFQLLQRRMHVDDPRQVARLSFAIPVCYYVFDLLAFDEFELRGLRLEDRKTILADVIRGEGPVRYCDHVLSRGRDFYHAVEEQSLEGIIAKKRDAPYRGTRSSAWLKIKCPLTKRFVIGGYTDPAGSRTHFGALLLGQFDSDGSLRFTDKVGTGFDRERLKTIYALLQERARTSSPFRKPRGDEPVAPQNAHFVEPNLVCSVRFSEYTDTGGIRAPSLLGLIEDADPAECLYEGPRDSDNVARSLNDGHLSEPGVAIREATMPNSRKGSGRASLTSAISHPDKVFWPNDGYTKADLVGYYRSISKWMLPYLKDRPVMLARYPDGIEGKNFYQKDAPGFAPSWMRTEKIYSPDSKRWISYFILDTEEALAYVANLAAITIHIWSSRVPHHDNPDWLLFDIDPKGSTTRAAVEVAREVAATLRKVGLEPCLKTSGQMGLHVVVGLKPQYSYDQAIMFSELVSRLVVKHCPKVATLNRNPSTRQGKVYIDYMQLGHGKTIAAPFTVRTIARAPVSAPMNWKELKPSLDPSMFNIKTMPARMKRIGRDPFLDALTKPATLEEPFERLEKLVKDEN